MRRRRFLSAVAGATAALAGCRSGPESPGTGSPTATGTATPSPTPTGRVDNHRTTAAEVRSHGVTRVETDDGPAWVVTVTLRMRPQDPAVATPYPVGVFFLFFDAEGDQLAEQYRTVAANTGEAAYTVTRSVRYESAEATDRFRRYRIDVVHG